jgi:hypothetical protein
LGPTSEVSAQRDVAGLVGLGFRVPHTRIRLGAGGEVLRTQLLEEYSGIALAGSLGAHLDVPSWGASFGTSAQHLGGRLKLSGEPSGEKGASLPSLVRVGAAWAFNLAGKELSLGRIREAANPGQEEEAAPVRFTIMAEYMARISEGAEEYGAGVEFVPAAMLALRAGFRTIERGLALPQNEYTFGLGVAFNYFKLDYSAEMLPFAYVHRIGFIISSRPAGE